MDNWEILQKIEQAQKSNLQDFRYTDDDGVEVEVHIENVDPDILKQFDNLA